MKDKIIIAFLLFMTSLFLHAQEKVQVKALPKEGTEFVAKYFKDQKVKTIFKVMDDRKPKYEVTLENGTEIEMNDRGRWTEIEGKNNAVPTGFLKEATTNYLKANYATQRVLEIEKGPRFVFVELENGIKLQFEAEGKFNRIYTED
ncbi:PepSY-like domain-containing protein [Flavobacterium soli]|uniref:PepSY-like domain-containing protein n=1 Tax=Flavobacterium soli TaxID=344881 RepID=UPI0003F8B58E|nr:PepSY-like domain-containing protein [Flavobacterium soli]